MGKNPKRCNIRSKGGTSDVTYVTYVTTYTDIKQTKASCSCARSLASVTAQTVMEGWQPCRDSQGMSRGTATKNANDMQMAWSY